MMLQYLNEFALGYSIFTLVFVIYRDEKYGPENHGNWTMLYLSAMGVNIVNLILLLS